MSFSKSGHAYSTDVFHPFKTHPTNVSYTAQKSNLTRKNNRANHDTIDFAKQLNFLLTEKSALKLDYQKMEHDLKQFSFDLTPIDLVDKSSKNKTQHITLDKIRLKYSLDAMTVYNQEAQRNFNYNHENFYQEVTSAYSLLVRDYNNLCETFKTHLQQKKQADLNLLTDILNDHIQLYNKFSYIINDYLKFITA